MGRRKDNPLEQAAKGFPGRRRVKVESAIAEIESAVNEGEREAAKGRDPFPLPPLFKKQPAYWREAAALWHELSSVLKSAGRLRPGYRPALTRYCIWTQLFNSTASQLNKDLPKGGTTVKVRKGDGNEVYRTHPGLEFMSKAETQLRLLDAEFGFTPMRDQDLMRVETFNAAQGRFKFGDHPRSAHSADGDDPLEGDPIGLMNDDDAMPPGLKPN
ncbi:P27 family phage terminase small subunit [Martelella soudanensis]|uniref:P27 family phage terminase small subunit n=1 Tax=unclassified Martelella TaxID=2629616 RepID=UPI0015DE0FCB|nr:MULTISPECIES: P27 family phage terminase small subunit [unclassified Martelella]